jgi:outer membrane protein TolC
MRIKVFIILTAIFSVAACGLCEENPIFDKDAFIASANAKKTLELGMVDCVAMALKNNSEINVKRISTHIEDANVMIQKARFEPDLSFDFTVEDNTDLSSSFFSAVGTTKTRTGKFNFGYAEKLVTGTMLNLNFYNTRTRTNTGLQTMNPTFDSEAELTITQPLLKGFGILVNKADFLIAKNNRLRSTQDLALEIMRVLTDVKAGYYNLLYYQELYKIAEASLERIQSLHEILMERYSKGASSDVELLESEAEVARSGAELLAAEASLKLAEDSLKLITNIVDNPEYWNAAVTLLNRPEYERREADLVESIKKAFDHRPDYEAAKIDLRNKDISIVVNRNGMLPTMDLIASYGLNGLDKVYEKDLAHVGGGKYEDWVLGVKVTMPLGSGEEKGKYEKSKLDKRQALINFKRLEQRIILEVRDAVRKVDIKYRMLEASTKAKEAREREYEAQEQRFKAGLVSTHDILDYAERLSRAEAGQIKGIIDYNISLIELAKAEGMTLVEENVKIE